MINFNKVFLALTFPALVFLGCFGFIQREGSSRVKAMPAFAVGIGLIFYNEASRKSRRKRLLDQLRLNISEKKKK